MAVQEQAEPVVTATDRRNARLYLTGLAASLLGDSAMSLVAGIWVKSLTGSSAAAGLVSACMYLPSLFGPAAGLLADRVPRRRLLLVLNVGSAVFVLTLLAVRSAAEVWLIFCVMIWYGASLAVGDPAENALFAEMLPASLRQRVNGWRLGLQETGRLVAPLFGAALFALVGGGSVAALDSVTFVVAALAVAGLRLREPAPRPPATNWRADLLAGLVHVRRTPELARLLVTGGFVIVLSGLLVAPQYSLIQAIGEPPAFLGVLSACLGAGSIVASLVSSRLLRRLGEDRLAMLGMINFIVNAGLRATGNLPCVVIAALVGGFALPWTFLAILSLAQRRTPLGLQGRVSALVSLVLFGPQAPVQALGSLAIRYLSYRQVYLAGAALAAAATGALIAFSRRGDPRITDE
ncbi:MAG: MFS transporter [Actinobacteria bacterium]|nr:MFS transporter [Actinomycetota bacterium]